MQGEVASTFKELQSRTECKREKDGTKKKIEPKTCCVCAEDEKMASNWRRRQE